MKQIGTEAMSDWPIHAHTLREILAELGFEILENDNNIDFVCGHLNRKLLNAYPLLLEDDGMGYGVNPKFVTEVSTDVYNESGKESNYFSEPVFNIFIDKQHD